VESELRAQEPLRGTHRMGFQRFVGSGHAGIFQRRGKARFSIAEMVGLAATADACMSIHVQENMRNNETHLLISIIILDCGVFP
jgi:hypothetical protein